MSSNNENRHNTPGGGRGPMGGHGPRRGGPMGGPMAMMPGAKAKDFKGSVKKLAAYLSPYKFRILAVVLFAIGSVIFTIVGPKVLARATNELYSGIMGKLTGTGEGINFTNIRNIMLTLIGLYSVSAGFSLLQGYIMTGVTMKVTYNLRTNIMKKINKMPLNYFDKTNHGEVLSRVTNDIDTLSQSLNQSITQMITSFTTVVGILVMMLSISVRLTVIALLTIPVSLLLIIGVVKKSQKYFKSQQEYLGHVNGHVEEMYGGHVVMKAFNGEEKSVKKFDEYNDTLYESSWKAQFLSGLMMPMMTFVGNLGYVAICILGGWMASKGTLNVGDIQAFIQYVRNFTQPLSQLANISNVLQQTVASAERVFEFLEEEEEVQEEVKYTIAGEGESPSESKVKIEGNVEFKNVHFGYDPEKIIINDFSAKAKAGQKIAIVGPTGAGKTTLVKLLMRFYDVNDGEILIDGHNIRDFSREDLRSLFGMVLQDTWLYNGTIMDNIRYGNLSASEAEVRTAAKVAQVDHFVATLPGGYNMVLNEDASNVSQGQKQLLTIARAFLSDPKILILDEATSSVDTRTEVLIQKAMDNLMKGRTSFVIAHRLSTIKNADLILCINDGDIVEQGTHNELLKLNGFYSKLYNSQFEKTSA